MARRFAFTSVPIAIGYHVAHYLTFLLIQGQYIIPLLSDPFGFGWNLFGTAGYRVDIALVGARFAWYAAVTAILIGHIAAVYLAHREAMQHSTCTPAALRSQVPLTALMVVYTFVSLSILAEPMVERRAPAQPSRVAAEVGVPGRRGAAGAGNRPPAGGGRRQDRTAEADLPHDGLGLPRRHPDERRRPALCLHVRVSLGARGEAPDADPMVAAATAVLRAQLVGVRVRGDRQESKSFRVGDFDVIRELLVVEVYTSVPPLDPRAGCGDRPAVERAALASHGADGGSGRPRLGGVFAGARRSAAASNGSIWCALRT